MDREVSYSLHPIFILESNLNPSKPPLCTKPKRFMLDTLLLHYTLVNIWFTLATARLKNVFQLFN